MFSGLRFAADMSFKIDGVRGFNESGVTYSRTGKAFPNGLLQEKLKYLHNLDFEIAGASIDHPNLCDKTRSITNSHGNSVDGVSVWVFDHMGMDNKSFEYRLERAHDRVLELNGSGFSFVNFVDHFRICNIDDFLAFEEKALNAGLEGVMGRKPRGPYKHGRSTMLDQYLWKFKRFVDVELPIVGFEEGLSNQNAVKYNEQGYMDRQTLKSGMVPANTLGKIIVDWHGQELKVSCGKMKHSLRKFVWENKSAFYGVFFTMRYFGYGIKNLPRFPRFITFRDPKDDTLMQHLMKGYVA